MWTVFELNNVVFASRIASVEDMDRHDEASSLLWLQVEAAAADYAKDQEDMRLAYILAAQIRAFNEHFTERRTLQ